MPAAQPQQQQLQARAGVPNPQHPTPAGCVLADDAQVRDAVCGPFGGHTVEGRASMAALFGWNDHAGGDPDEEEDDEDDEDDEDYEDEEDADDEDFEDEDYEDEEDDDSDDDDEEDEEDDYEDDEDEDDDWED